MRIKYIKDILLVFSITSFILLLFTCGGKTQFPISSAELDRFLRCEEDTDCIFVNNGCCDCANGGIEIAINASLLPDFLNLFDCSNVSCTEMARQPACASGTVKCSESGKCDYELPSAAKFYLKQ